jgi:hypothetical protein
MDAPDAEIESQFQRTTPATVGRKRDRIQQRHQAAALQRFAYDAAMSLRAGCTDNATGQVAMDAKTALAVHKLVGAWDTAADRLRVLKGKGLPASERRQPRREAPAKPLSQTSSWPG